MAVQRSASRSTRWRFFTSVFRVASSGVPESSVRTSSFAKVRMPASGLLISWAMEAESFPSDESFSLRISCSCAVRSAAVRSCTFRSRSAISSFSSSCVGGATASCR